MKPKKRVPKINREKAQREALKQRVRDWVYGSSGRLEDDEPWHAKLISDVMRAMSIVFDLQPKDGAFFYWNIESFDTIETATNFLFERGFRATGTIVGREKNGGSE